MKIEKYLKDVVGSVGIEVDENNLLLTSQGTKIMYNTLPIAIPNMDIVNKQRIMVGGELVQQYSIFNPFSEDDLKRNQMLVLLMRYMSAISTAGLLSGVIMMLVEVLSNEEVQSEVSTKMQSWITQLKSKVKGGLMDKKTTKEVTKIIMYLVDNNLELVKYRTSKGETIAGVKYNRLAKLDTAAVEAIKEKQETIGVSDKTVTIFLSMLEFALPEMENIYAGSKHKKYPSYVSAIDVYNEVQGRINFLIKELSEIFDMPDAGLLMPLAEGTEDIDTFSKEIDFLPNQNKIDVPKEESMLSRLTKNVTAVNNPSTIALNNVNDATLTVSNDTEYMDGMALMRAQRTGGKNVSGFINTNNVQVIDQRMNRSNGTMSIQDALNMNAQQQQNNLFGNSNTVNLNDGSNNLFGNTQQTDLFGFSNSNSLW